MNRKFKKKGINNTIHEKITYKICIQIKYFSAFLKFSTIFSPTMFSRITLRQTKNVLEKLWEWIFINLITEQETKIFVHENLTSLWAHDLSEVQHNSFN